MSFEGFTFTPEQTPKELTPEEKKERALSRLDQDLDEIIRETKEEERKIRLQKGEKEEYHRKRNHRNHMRNRNDNEKIINLDLTDREIQRYLCFANIDTSEYNVKLRLVMKRK